VHDSLVQVVNDSELLELGLVLNHILLDLLHLVIKVVVDLNGVLIGIIVEVNEAVVEEESAVAFLAVAIVDLVTSLDVIEGIDDEAAFVIGVVPSRLPWPPVIQHVCIGNKAIGLNAFDLDAENTR
jgi:hypothetical protein